MPNLSRGKKQRITKRCKTAYEEAREKFLMLKNERNKPAGQYRSYVAKVKHIVALLQQYVSLSQRNSYFPSFRPYLTILRQRVVRLIPSSAAACAM